MFLSVLLSSLRHWLRYRETMHQLSRLSDRELSDIGINRSNLSTVAPPHYWPAAQGSRPTHHQVSAE